MQKQSYMGVLLRWLAFTALVLSIFYWIEPAFSSSRKVVIHHAAMETILGRHGDMDVLFLGTSHIYRAIQPDIIKQMVPVNSAVLWLPGSDTRNAYFMLKKAVKAGKKPELVVLDSYSLVLESSMYLAALPLSDQLLVFEDALQFFPFNNHLTRISMVFANHANWKDSQAFREILSEFFTYYVYKPDEQYMEAVLKEQFSEGSSRSASLVRYSKNDEQNVIGLNAFKIFQLTRMAEYCRDQGIRLVIVEVPTLNPSGIPVSKVRQLASEMHLPFHDFGEVFRGSYPEGHSLFREGAPNSHLNFNGSLLFSRFMAEMLAQELGLPYNSSASQKATRLVQTGLRIEDAVSADKTEINLILDPLHPDRALTYVWVVRDATGEILRKQSGAQNAFPIHIGYWGVENYQVEVKISSSDDPQEHLLLTIPLY